MENDGWTHRFRWPTHPRRVVPGNRAAVAGPVMEEAFGLFTDADVGRFWLLEGHWTAA